MFRRARERWRAFLRFLDDLIVTTAHDTCPLIDPESGQEAIVTSAKQLGMTPGAFVQMVKTFEDATGAKPQAIVVQNKQVQIDVMEMVLMSDLPIDVKVVVDPEMDPDIVQFVVTRMSDLEIMSMGPDEAIGQI